MEVKKEGKVGSETSSISPPANGPRRSFRNHISKFGHASSLPAQSSLPISSYFTPSQTPSPALKRKRSPASDFQPDAELDTPQNFAYKGESSITRHNSTPRSKGTSSSHASPVSPTAIVSNLRDTLRPNLVLVLIGLNPGLTTAKLGHPYSHPSNGFWKVLHTSGITPVQHRPQDHPLLPDLYGIGNTNICARPSRLGSELSKAELSEGAKILDDKMALYRPEAACITGKGVWEEIWRYKVGKKKMPREGPEAFRYGWQDEKLWLGRLVDLKNGEVVWKGSRTFVAPSTSGLNAGMSAAEKEEVWRPIGEWMTKKREEKDQKTEKEAGNDIEEDAEIFLQPDDSTLVHQNL